MAKQKMTAVAVLYKKETRNGADHTNLYFNADYNDERNKEWALYTPALSLSMNVLTEIADQFDLQGRYLLTFEKQD